ncbi:MAG TPA: dihydropteroate synthase [Coleofasciculaceae cyanobacterium]|jgi:dihydropteroate synthase
MPYKTKIMAILNVTPDSFSDGGQLANQDILLQAAAQALTAGADILDIGGESTRPGAEAISEEEELARVVPSIEAIRKHFPEAVISIDTRKSAVAEAALQVGASIINDVSGLQYDPEIATVAALHAARLILMHSQGTPETMQINPAYPTGVIPEIKAFFARQIERAVAAGVRREHMILDPGFGFGKTLQHNLELLHYISDFSDFGLPLLAGTSRKSFLTLGDKEIAASEREALTAATLALAIQGGAGMVRVHDARAQAPVVRMIDAVLNTRQEHVAAR